MSAEIITIGGGCFWCIEAIMQRVKGVLPKLNLGTAEGWPQGIPLIERFVLVLLVMQR